MGSSGIVRGLLSASGARIAVMGVGLLCTAYASKLVFSTSGADLYGAVMLVATLQVLIPFADLGLGAVVMNAVARRRFADQLQLEDVLRRVFLTLVVVATVLSVIALCLYYSGFIGDFIGALVPRTNGADTATFVALLAVAWSIPLGVGYRILVGMDRTHIGVLISAISPVLVVVSIVALYGAEGAEGWALAIWPVSSFVANLVTFLTAIRISRLSARTFFPHPSVAKPFPRSPILGVSASMFAISVAMPLAYQSHRLILGQVGSAEALAQYSLGAQIYGPILSVVTIASTTLWPRFAQRSDDAREQSRLWVRTTAAFGASGIVLAGFVVVLVPIYSLYVTGQTLYVPWLVVILFATLLALNALLYPTLMRMNDGRDIGYQAVAAVIAAGLAVPLAFWWTPIFGAAGPLLAALVAVLVAQIAPLWTILLKRETGWPRSRARPDGEDSDAEETRNPTIEDPLP